MATKSPPINDSSHSRNCYYPSPLHEEALARLAYLAENGSACGLLLGPVGCGKSLILDRFARQQRQQGAAVAAVNGIGTSAVEMLLEIGTAWGAKVRISDTLSCLWQKTADRLRELNCEQVPALLLIDDIHQTPREAAAVVDRLHSFAEANAANLVLIAVCEATSQQALTDRLLSRAELRVELDLWTLDETTGFLQQWLAQASGENQEFDEQAIEVLHELAEGNPRRVRQLAELTMLAGSGISKSPLRPDVVQAAYEEMCAGC